MRTLRVLITLLAFVAAGCASTRPASPSNPSWTSCPANPNGDAAALTLPDLSADFRAVTAIICAQDSQKRPDGGTDLVAVEDRADDIADLLTALRLPDEPRTDMPCQSILITGPWLALLDEQGRWVRPGFPTTACGTPKPQVLEAIDGLTRSRVSTRVVAEIESAGAAKSGCSQTWSDMIAATGADAVDGEMRPLTRDRALPQLCVYRVPASEQGNGKPAGDFESGRRLRPAEWAAVKRHLASAGPATACRMPAGRFALLSGNIYVELDSCRRVMAPANSGNTLRQAPDALVTLLS
ncbi:hypothetical protein AB0M20_12325 [Actinoplanes sp. NPDC051633]|uniref:hypothetical protein n=1 Tax=Actinoplanes sp. NPDC051633 TaxID=3155670 RepID=UPI00341E812F